MTTSCPLYYSTADILAAFSQTTCDVEAPPSSPVTDGRLVTVKRIIASALVWPAATSRRLIRPRTRGVRSDGAAPGTLPVRGAAPERSPRRSVDLGQTCRPGLRSHFALLAPAD